MRTFKPMDESRKFYMVGEPAWGGEHEDHDYLNDFEAELYESLEKARQAAIDWLRNSNEVVIMEVKLMGHTLLQGKIKQTRL